MLCSSEVFFEREKCYIVSSQERSITIFVGGINILKIKSLEVNLTSIVLRQECGFMLYVAIKEIQKGNYFIYLG